MRPPPWSTRCPYRTPRPPVLPSARRVTCFIGAPLGTVAPNMTALVDAPADARPEPSSPARRRPAGWLTVGVAAVVAVGVALRFFVRSHLWLDESLSVLIAR